MADIQVSNTKFDRINSHFLILILIIFPIYRLRKLIKSKQESFRTSRKCSQKNRQTDPDISRKLVLVSI